MSKIKWLPEPEEHDYPAAAAYLSLHLLHGAADLIVQKLRDHSVEHFKAKDIVRASGLSLLPIDDPHVARNLDKIDAGKELSPVLLVHGFPLIIADGWHRICAVYYRDYDANIPGKLA